MEANSEEWRELWSFESLDSVQLATVQALESSGIAVPRGEPKEIKGNKKAFAFGIALEDGHQPLLEYCYRGNTFQLPRLFVKLVEFLEQCPSHEGVFRKSGSVSRQRALRSSFESGNLALPEDTYVHDVASLLKQYLRELPDPLLTQHFSLVYEACHALLPSEGERTRCILLTCLLLPRKHCQALCVLMKLLNLVCEKADQSLMNSTNLSVVMAPNLMKPSNNILTPTGNPLQIQTDIVKLLIENWNLIGQVPPDVGVASESLASELRVLGSQSLENVIDEEGVGPLPQRYGGRKGRKKQRTASISGLVLGLGSRLKQKGVALTSGDYHMTSRGLLRRKMSMKRKTRSQEDLLLPNKRAAVQSPLADSTDKATPIPHPQTAKTSKARSILINRRHGFTDGGGKIKRRRSSCEPNMIFKPSLTVRLEFGKQDEGEETGQTSLTDQETGQTSVQKLVKPEVKQDQETDSAQTSASCKPVAETELCTFSVVASRPETSSFLFATPQAPISDPHTLTPLPSPFTNPEGDCIQVASFPITPAVEIGTENLTSNATYGFSNPTLLGTKSNQGSHDKATPTSGTKTTPTAVMDQAFLQTPFTADRSPNLLEKISSEIALRHYSRSSNLLLTTTPLMSCDQNVGVARRNPRLAGGNMKVNESYKKAIGKGGGKFTPHHPLLPTKVSLSQQNSQSFELQNSVTPQRNISDAHTQITGQESHMTTDQGHMTTEQCDSRVDEVSRNSSVMSGDSEIVCFAGPLNLSVAAGEEGEGLNGCHGDKTNAMSTDSKDKANVSLSMKTGSRGRNFAYSATLGMSADLLTRPPLRQHKTTPTTTLPSNDQLQNVSLDNSTASSPRPTSRLIDSSYHHSPSALSASLGITQIIQNNRRPNTPFSIQAHASLTRSHSNSPMSSTPPALLRILESNVMSSKTTTDTFSDSSNQCSHQSQSESPIQRQQEAKQVFKTIDENLNSSLKQSPTDHESTDSGCVQQGDYHIHEVPQVIEVAPELTRDKLHSTRKRRNKDCLVTQPPSPRVPLGLRSPWLWSKKERPIQDGTRMVEDGHVTKRAQAYVVPGHAHQYRWRHAPLKRVSRRTTDMSDKENCYYDNMGVANKSSNTHTKEWVV